MRIFNIGIREVLVLLVLMLILFGPNQMKENARKLAQGIRRVVRSDTWRSFLGIVDDVNTIKDQVVRESGLKEVQDSLRGVNRQITGMDDELRGAGQHLFRPDPNYPDADQKRPEENKDGSEES